MDLAVEGIGNQEMSERNEKLRPKGCLSWVWGVRGRVKDLRQSSPVMVEK